MICDSGTQETPQLQKDIRAEKSELRLLFKSPFVHVDHKFFGPTFIQDVYFRLSLSERTNIFVYLNAPNELSLIPFMAFFFQQKHNLFIPAYWSRDSSQLMRFIKLNSLEELNQFDQTDSGIPIPPSSFVSKIDSKFDPLPDVIFVPGLAFDYLGNRLGRGLGHFDRYIAHIIMTYKITPLLVGIIQDRAFFKVKSLPIEAHDIRMNYIITEDQLIKCE